MLVPIFKFATNKDDVDFFCNCPNCKDIIGKITYGYKYEGGVALEGFKVCKTCQEPIDWAAVVDRFQISPEATYDLDFKDRDVSLGTRAPKPFDKRRMDKCLAILESLKAGAEKYLSKKEEDISEDVNRVVEYLLEPIDKSEELEEIER